MPSLFRRHLLTMLFAPGTLPRLLQARRAHLPANRRHCWKSSPDWIVRPLGSDVAHFLGVLSLFAGVIATVLLFVYFQVSFDSVVNKTVLKSTLWTIFFILTIIAGIAAWLFVLAHESRGVAEEESRRQTDL